MKVWISNGPRRGEVVEVDRSWSTIVLRDPIIGSIASWPLDPLTPTSILYTDRIYTRARLTPEQWDDVAVQYGADGVIFDAVLAKREHAEEEAKRREHDRLAAMDPDELKATMIEEHVWHNHCESCEQDGEYPCCVAYRMVEDRSPGGESND